ncbi:hypothetical protein JVU11DRAFT_12103 [Chiua virens]|nr:hypothetical protein JVU11DRAFT_12103 [Chiua virens]
MCRGGDPPHAINLKSFIPVQFSLAPSSTHSTDSTPVSNEVKKVEEAKHPICPSCKTNLSNNKILFLMKPCSHVVCKVCTDSLVRPASQCIVCDRKLTDPDIVELKREGTELDSQGVDLQKQQKKVSLFKVNRLFLSVSSYPTAMYPLHFHKSSFWTGIRSFPRDLFLLNGPSVVRFREITNSVSLSSTSCRVQHPRFFGFGCTNITRPRSNGLKPRTGSSVVRVCIHCRQRHI